MYQVKPLSQSAILSTKNTFYRCNKLLPFILLHTCKLSQSKSNTPHNPRAMFVLNNQEGPSCYIQAFNSNEPCDLSFLKIYTSAKRCMSYLYRILYERKEKREYKLYRYMYLYNNPVYFETKVHTKVVVQLSRK